MRFGWEKLPSGSGGHSWSYLLGEFFTDGRFRDDIMHNYLAPKSLQWLLALAIVGIVVSIVLQIRLGLWMGILTVTTAVLFIAAPESRLWNVRLLPFWAARLLDWKPCR